MVAQTKMTRKKPNEDLKLTQANISGVRHLSKITHEQTPKHKQPTPLLNIIATTKTSPPPKKENVNKLIKIYYVAKLFSL